MRRATAVGLVAFGAASFVAPARAQGFYWSLAYEPSVPIGGIRNASPHPTPAGGSLSARYLFTKHASIGLGGHWTHFTSNNPPATYAIDNGAVTGAVYRRVWVASLLAEAFFYFRPEANVTPYAGLGTGISWMSNMALVSDFAFEDLSTGFTLCPEAGLLIALQRELFDPSQTPLESAIVGIRYTHSTAQSRDVTNTSFIGITVGLLAY
jgi:hypothetical protein